MHLRSASTTSSQRNAAGKQYKNSIEPTSDVPYGVYGTVHGITKKRLIISALLMLQVCALGYFWLVQFDSVVINHNDVRSLNTEGTNDLQNEVESEHRIQFVPKASIKTVKIRIINSTSTNSETFNFYKDFVLYKVELLNKSIEKDTFALQAIKSEQFKLCFREGIENEAGMNPEGAYAEAVVIDQVKSCQCKSEWHGSDCGQPEVVWRTLLAAKRTESFHLHRPMIYAPHRLVYMLNGHFFSLDILELQIKTVAECVDYFIINIMHIKIGRTRMKAIKKRLKSILKTEQYLINHCGRPRVSGVTSSASCSPKQAYKLFKYAISEGQIPAIKSTDIFLFSNDAEILNRKALKFIKYYYNAASLIANRSQLNAMQFRLKHVVYGFYWQHPKLTHVGGFLSSFAALDHLEGGDGDPSLFVHRIVDTAETPAIIIGDLNHFGGWYCQLCQQPEEIIDVLYAALEATNRESTGLVQFPNVTKNQQIDVSYIKTLISQGQLIDDNKPSLLKLRSYSDKYYAPAYAQQCSWKFGNLLFNLHASIEEDIDNEYK